MNPSHCEKEQEVLEAVRSGGRPGRWEDALRVHVAHCQVCADVALVAKFLQQETELAGAEAKLPEAGLVWWKAQLLARRMAAERATQPIALAEKLALAWGILSLVGATIWQWPHLHDWLKRFGSYWTHPSFLASWQQLPTFAVIMGVGLSALFMAFVLYIVWAEE